MHKYNPIPEDLIQTMMKDRKVRKTITKKSFWFFFNLYFGEYVVYPTANFQMEIIHQLEKDPVENLYLVAFRNSGKSTIATTAYPLWAILGDQKKKYVLIFCKTQGQAKQTLSNIRVEAEHNTLLKQDLGPFRSEEEFGTNGQWSSTTLEFLNTGSRIKVASVDEGIRGLRHKQYRPDLIICDDVEDINSTKTRESRDKTYKWLRGDVIPAGDRNTKLVVLGNLLHEDSLLMRLKDDIENGNATGTFLEFPLITDSGTCMWEGKYPTAESIEDQRKEVGSKIEWQREFLLNIVPDLDKVIHREWIQYYSDLPEKDRTFGGVCIGIDLAVSKNTAADYTAMVSAYVFTTREKETTVYILPNPVNERMTSPDTIDRCKQLYNFYKKQELWPKLIVEDVGYQKSVIQHLENAGMDVQGFKPGNQDKRARLALTAPLIKSGNILFPKQGCERLIQQLVNFGVEKNDDLSDAFSTLILGLSEDPPRYRHSVHDIIVGGKPREWPFDIDGPDRITMNTRF